MRRNGTVAFAGIVATALLATGCTGIPAKVPAAIEPAPASSDLRGSIAKLAHSMVGIRYRYGGAHSRDGFDCSGLVFFQNQEKLSHVGIYLGDGRFVHAPSSGGVVSVANIDAPYHQRYLGGVGRLIP